jgi:Ca2+-transporting ATPase
MMQIFNMVNARKLKNDEYNVFADFFNNIRFIVILVLIIVVQIALIYVGGRAFKTDPLNETQQIVCVSLGAFSLIWGVIIKLIMPPQWFDWLSIDEKELEDKEELDTFQSQLRRSYRHSRTFRESKSGPNATKTD